MWFCLGIALGWLSLAPALTTRSIRFGIGPGPGLSLTYHWPLGFDLSGLGIGVDLSLPYHWIIHSLPLLLCLTSQLVLLAQPLVLACWLGLLAWHLGLASWLDLLAWPLGLASWLGLLACHFCLAP